MNCFCSSVCEMHFNCLLSSSLYTTNQKLFATEEINLNNLINFRLPGCRKSHTGNEACLLFISKEVIFRPWSRLYQVVSDDTFLYIAGSVEYCTLHTEICQITDLSGSQIPWEHTLSHIVRLSHVLSQHNKLMNENSVYTKITTKYEVFFFSSDNMRYWLQLSLNVYISFTLTI